MNKKTIIISILIFVGIIGLMWWGRSNQTIGSSQIETRGESALVVSEILYDFGTISMKNGLVNHIFKVTNSSQKDVEIKKVSTSCMCTSAYIEYNGRIKGPFGMEGMGYLPPANETIKVGESRDVKVVYDPNAHGPSGVGSIDRFVYLVDASGGTLQLGIKAVVTP